MMPPVCRIALWVGFQLAQFPELSLSHRNIFARSSIYNISTREANKNYILCAVNWLDYPLINSVNDHTSPETFPAILTLLTTWALVFEKATGWTGRVGLHSKVTGPVVSINLLPSLANFKRDKWSPSAMNSTFLKHPTKLFFVAEDPGNLNSWDPPMKTLLEVSMENDPEVIHFSVNLPSTVMVT